MKVTDRLKHYWFLTSLALALCLGSFGAPKGQASVSPARPDNQNGPDRPDRNDRMVLGKSCSSSDTDFLCLGIKYVVYAEQSSQPVISANTVEKNIAAVNAIWSQCKIGFQVDQFVTKNPNAAGLPPDTANFSDLDQIRQAFNEDSKLLIVTTYKWKRDGNLGHTPANAWTKMPGSGLYGIILEQKVGAFPNIIAHELGHYLNLYHANEKSEVMNAIIYDNSSVLTREQCATARTSVTKWWSNMVRRVPPMQPDQPQLAHEQSQRSRSG